MQAVEEVEQQRDGDQRDQQRRQFASSDAPAQALFDDDAADAVGHVLEAVHDLFQMVVDFGADDEVHRVAAAVLDKSALMPSQSCRSVGVVFETVISSRGVESAMACDDVAPSSGHRARALASPPAR